MTDFDICKSNWKRTLVSSPEKLALDDSEIQKKLKECETRAVNAHLTMKKSRENMTDNTIFIGRKCISTADMSEEYVGLRNMALGYATYGTSTYKDGELLGDILWALEWMYNRYYGKAEMENRGWRDIRQFNWYDWKIKTPKFLMDTMLLVDEHLSLKQKRDYIALFNMLVKKPFDYSSNKVEFGSLMVESGLLTEDENVIWNGINGIEDTYLYVDGGLNDGQGFYRDGSYIFHTRHAQNNTYGLAHFSAQVHLVEILSGSPFALDEKHTSLLYEWMYKHFVPFFAKGETLRSVMGRDPETVTGRFNISIKSYINLYAISSEDFRERVSAVIQFTVKENPLFKNGENSALFKALTINQYVLYREIISRVTAESFGVEGFFAYNSMDRAVQHTKGYTMSLAMSSSRIYNYECINGQNLSGWYVSDGALCCHTGQMQYSEEYWKYHNPYRVAGTTVDDRERLKVSIAQGNEYLSSKDFVGSLSVGNSGVSVMQLEGYHSDGTLRCTLYYKPTGEYGSAPPPCDSTLTANKAYFFLRGVTVCLGSNINSSDGKEVYTVLENRMDPAIIENGEIIGRKECCVTVNGEKVELCSEDKRFENVARLTIDEEEIVLPKPHALKIRRNVNAVGFTEIVWPHGKNPVDETYAYLIFPEKNKEGLEEVPSLPLVEILENSSNIQALADNTDNALYFVFHSSGKCARVEVETPLLVAIRGETLYATDITQKLGRATVKVDGIEYHFDFSEKYGKTLSLPLMK